MDAVQGSTARVRALSEQDPVVVSMIGRELLAFFAISLRLRSLHSGCEFRRRSIRSRPEKTVSLARRADQLACILRHSVLIALFRSVIVLRIHSGFRGIHAIPVVRP